MAVAQIFSDDHQSLPGRCCGANQPHGGVIFYGFSGNLLIYVLCKDDGENIMLIQDVMMKKSEYG